MCYLIYFSTDSEEDLGKLTSDLLHIYPVEDPGFPDLSDVLTHPNKWFLECRYGGCSCHFRHADMCVPRRAPGTDPDFALPNDADPEDDDIIESTQAAYDIFRRLVDEGFKVEVYDSWNDEFPARIAATIVDIDSVSRDAFRFVPDLRLDLR